MWEVEGEVLQLHHPTSEELLKVSNLVRCPECKKSFGSKSNLNLHQIKTHKRTNLPKTDKHALKMFYCPETTCTYYIVSKPFRSLKLLKQHYIKVHAAKQFTCNECSKCFPLRSTYDNHLAYCGVNFTCNTCTANYDCYETLKTHARRKCHSIAAKTCFSRMPQKDHQAAVTQSRSDTLVSQPRSRFIYFLPKPAAGSGSDDQLISKSSQTEIKPKITVLDNTKFAETQTVGDYRLKKSNSSEESFDKNTQTKKVPSSTKSCNTSLVLNDNGDIDISNVSKESMHSSTQTNLQIPIDNHNYEPTTSACNLPSLEDDDDTLFFNMETQTDCNELINDMLDGDYYSNMYTQTCSDFFNEELGLNNICTQTMFDDELLRSVESQTMMSHNSGSFTMCRDFNHMETQTDAEFKELLDAINA